jgi:ATP-dependent helicase Lhr and Lhr-like helicase
MNVGTIVEAPDPQGASEARPPVPGRGRRVFRLGLLPGDTFIFAGQLLAFEGIRENEVIASRAKPAASPRCRPMPAAGCRSPPTSPTGCATSWPIPEAWDDLPPAGARVAADPGWRSSCRRADGLLVECFPRGGKAFLVAYCFEGRNAHQTLGMLLTRRMERAGPRPLGFVATDYVIAVWSLKAAEDVDALFAEDMLGDDLEEWMAESSMLKRTFRNVAVIAGLIERRSRGARRPAAR